MCRIVITVVISVWAGLCTVAAQEPPRGPQRIFLEDPRNVVPGRIERKGPIGEPPADSPSPPSRPARQPRIQVLAEPVPVVPARDGARQHKRLALRLRGASANDLANTLNNLLQAEGQAGPAAAARRVVVVPEASGNSLLIGGPPEAVDDVRQLVEELDRPAPLVLLEVVIAEAPAGEVKPAPTKMLARVRLVAANNKVASLTLGRSEPRIRNVVVSPFGQTLVDRHLIMTGIMLGISPRVRPDGTVVFHLDISDSRLGLPQEDAAGSGAKDNVMLPEPIESLHASTTLCLRDGETAVLGGRPPQAKASEQLLILVTPHVIHTLANP